MDKNWLKKLQKPNLNKSKYKLSIKQGYKKYQRAEKLTTSQQNA